MGLAAVSPTATSVLIVPPHVPALHVAVQPWADVSVAAGGGAVDVRVTAHGAPTSVTSGLRAVSASVNGEDVAASLAETAPGVYTLQWTSGAGDDGWPWRAVSVSVSLTDGVFETSTTAAQVPGAALVESLTAPLVPSGETVSTAPLAGAMCVTPVHRESWSGTMLVYVAVADGPDEVYVVSGNAMSGVLVTAVALDSSAAAAASEAHRACAWVDLDGDGRMEVVAVGNGTAVLRRTDAVGSVLPEFGRLAAAGLPAASEGDFSAVATGDWLGTGAMELFIGAASPLTDSVVVSNAKGAGDFTAGSMPSEPGTVAAAAADDVDGDGVVEVIVAYVSPTGPTLTAYEAVMNLVLELREVWSAGTSGASDAAVVAGSVWVSAADGRTRLFEAAGDAGTLVEVGASVGLLVPDVGVGFSAVCAGDVNSDGVVDGAAVSQAASGSARVWLSAQSAWSGAARRYVDVAPSHGIDVRESSSCVFVDMNGDGAQDVVLGRHVYVNPNTAEYTGAGVVRVRPLTASGSASAYGAVVTVVEMPTVDGGALPGNGTASSGNGTASSGNSTSPTTDNAPPTGNGTTRWTASRMVTGSGSYDVEIVVPDVNGTYSVSVRWPWGAAANGTSHVGLAAVSPTATSVLVVRPLVPTITVHVEPWTSPDAIPTPSDGDATVRLVVSGTDPVHFTAISATVQGADVTSTFTELAAVGHYALTYTPPADDVMWPWTGVTVHVTLTDGVLEVSAEASAVPGTVLRDVGAALLLDGMHEHATAVCVVDVGTISHSPALFVPVSRSYDQLFVRDTTAAGGVVYQEAASSWGVAGAWNGTSTACAVGDVTLDGASDLFVVGALDAGVTLYERQPAGSAAFVAVSPPGLPTAGDYTAVAVADLSGDGHVDVVACRPEQPNAVLLSAGTGSNVKFVDAGLGPDTTAFACLAAFAADSNADGVADFMLLSETGLHIVRADGAMGALTSETFNIAAPSDEYYGAEFAFFAQDPVLSIWRTGAEAPSDALLISPAVGTATLLDTQPYPATITGAAPTAVDVDNDGLLDCVTVAGPVDVGADAFRVWLQVGAHPPPVLEDRAWLMAPATSPALATLTLPPVTAAVDVDQDGDVDVVLPRSKAVMTTGNHRRGWVKVRALTARGAPAAAVTVTVAVVLDTGASMLMHRVAGMDGVAHFGMPDANVANITASFSIPTSVHGLGGDATPGTSNAPGAGATATAVAVLPGRGTASSLRASPYVLAQSSVSPASGVVGLGGTVTVEVVDGPSAAPLVVTADAIVLINGVNVSASVVTEQLPPPAVPAFVPVAHVVDSYWRYTATYVPSLGDAPVPPGNLSVAVALVDATSGVRSHVLTAVTHPGTVAVTTVPPAVSFTCQPTPFSPRAAETFCMEVRDQFLPVQFAVEVEVQAGGAGAFVTRVPSTLLAPEAYTGIASGTFVTPVFENLDAVRVTVVATDAGGNVGPPTVAVYRVDLEPPVSAFVTAPSSPTNDPDAILTLSCSEAEGCAFEFSLDNGPFQAIGSAGGNSSDASSTFASLQTLPVQPPARRINTATPVILLGREVAALESFAAAVNDTIDVRIDEGTFVAFPLEVQLDPVTSEPRYVATVVPNPPLRDGTHIITARSVSADGSVLDVTPAAFDVLVDTAPPSVTLLRAPPVSNARTDVATFVFTSNELASGATFEYRWAPTASFNDAATPWLATSVGWLDVTSLPIDTELRMQLRAVDLAGNRGERVQHVWRTVGCGSAPPGLRDVFMEAVGPTGAKYVTFAVADDGDEGEAAAGTAGVEFEYSLDDAPWQRTDDPAVLIRASTLGVNHTLRLRVGVQPGCDETFAAVRPAPEEVTWLDAVQPAPSVSILSQPVDSTADRFAKFTFAASDPSTRLEYRLPLFAAGNTWSPAALRLTLGPLPPGEHRLEVRGTVGTGPSAVTTPVVSSDSWLILDELSSTVVLTGLPDGVHNVRVQAIDVSGQVEATPVRHEWEIDTAAPLTQLNLTSLPVSTSRNATVVVGCVGEARPCDFCWWFTEPPGADPTCVSFPGTTSSNASELAVTATADGPWTLVVAARDSGGNVDPDPPSESWVSDTLPPTTSGDIVAELAGLVPAPHLPWPSRVTRFASVPVNVSASERVRGYIVAPASSDTGPVGAPWNASHFVPPPASSDSYLLPGPFRDGLAVINIRAVDVAGNEAAAAHSVAVFVDTQPPSTSVVSAPPRFSNATTASFVLEASGEPPGGVQGFHVAVTRDGVAVDAAAEGLPEWVNATDPALLVLENLAVGTYNVTAAARDTANNVDPVGAWSVFEVDLTPPTSFFADAQPVAVVGLGYTSPNVTYTVTADEPGTSYLRVVLHADPLDLDPVQQLPWIAVSAATQTASVDVAALPDGRHIVEARSQDLAGNLRQPPYASQPLLVDTHVPVVTVQSTPPTFTREALSVVCATADDFTDVAFQASVQPAASIASVVVAPTGAVNTACIDVTVASALPAAVVAEANYTVSITAEDRAGNPSVPVFVWFIVDVTPPQVEVLASPMTSPSCETPPGGNTSYCRALSVNWQLGCTPGHPLAAACYPELYVEAVYAGGTDCAVDVDDGGGGGGSSSSSRRLRRAVMTVDGDADGAEGVSANPVWWEARHLLAPPEDFVQQSVFAIDAASDGLLELHARAVDVAGNTQPSDTVLAWYVDTQAPTKPVLVGTPDKNTAIRTATFQVQLPPGSDSSPGQIYFYWLLDSTDWDSAAMAELPQPSNFDAVSIDVGVTLDIGTHVFRVRARDEAGNAGVEEIFPWFVADTTPIVDMVIAPPPFSAVSAPLFSFVPVWDAATNSSRSGVEPAAGIQVRLGSSGAFTTICSSLEAMGNDTIGGGCSWRPPLQREGTFTMAARTVFAEQAGEAITHTWNYVLCSPTVGRGVGVCYCGCVCVCVCLCLPVSPCVSLCVVISY